MYYFSRANKHKTKMSQKTYALAAELTEQEIENVLALWEKEDAKSLSLFNSLVRLGDSRAMALATAIEEKADKIEDQDEIYRIAYYS